MMDARVKKTCPNCSQPFSLKSAHHKGRLPLLLTCGHSVCEVCIHNMIKFTEPVECKVCLREMEVTGGTLMLIKTNLHAIFPVNIFLLGELTLQNMEDSCTSKDIDNECFVDLKKIMNDSAETKTNCVECKGLTSKMCEQCVTVLCENCFQKTHKFHIFKNHILKDVVAIDVEPNKCKVHNDKPLDYYCNDCSKALCMDCMIVGGDKSCKDHKVVSAQEVNEVIYEELNGIAPKVDETFRRLTKTAVDIGYLLKNIEDGVGNSEYNDTKIKIQHHFSKLHSSIQKHEQEIMEIMQNLIISEKTSLKKAKISVSDGIKRAKMLMNKLNVILDMERKTKANFSPFLEEAKDVVNTPWYLTKEEQDQVPLKLVVNEDLCTLVNDYIHLEGNATSAYKLKNVDQIGADVKIPAAPSKPVFPPELAKDVREQHKTKTPKAKVPAPKEKYHPLAVPKFRSKSGSTTSVNSIGSDSSGRQCPSTSGDSFRGPTVQTVSPFPDNVQPKQLIEGSKELIYISHIIGPHDFFVQRSCHQNLVREMLREFRNASNWLKPSVTHIAEGKIYLAYNKTDKEWQRCRIISVDRRKVEKPLYFVFFMDFGSTEIVTADELRIIPAGRMHSVPLAIHCCLANVEPKNREWTSDDSVLIQKVIDNKQAVIYVRNIRSASNYNVTLVVDVRTFDEGISLADVLVFHERAKLINPNAFIPPIKGLDKPKIFFGNSDFRLKTADEVFITNVVSPDKFFVRKSCFQKSFDDLCDDLEEEYNLGVSVGTVYYPEKGMVCVAKINQDQRQSDSNGWRRVIVKELPGRLRVLVYLVDTGETLLLHYSALRYILPKFTELTALTTECHLCGITPYNNKWSPASVALMNSFQNKRLELYVEEVGHGRSIGVSLYDKTDPEDVVCLNTVMIKNKFAVTIGIFKFNRSSNEEELVNTKYTPLDKPKPIKKAKKPEIQILKKTTVSTNDADTELDAKDKGPIKLEVKVLSCISPSLIYVTLIDQQNIFQELYGEVQTHYNAKTASARSDWKVGDKCCTICTESKTWRRAVVVELDGQFAKVFYSDFASIEKIAISNLKELVPEFSDIGDAAIKCHLSGIMPAVGEEWPSLTKEFLSELISVYQRIFITKNGAIKDKSLPVELWVYHVIQGGALEPNKAEWRCLNKSIVEQGLAIPDKSQQDNVNKNNVADDMISFFNITRSVQELLQLELKEPEPERENTKSPSESSLVDGHLSDDEGSNDPKTVLISDWQPADDLSDQEFTGVPTYVDNDGVIYLHDVKQKDTLDLIQKALEVRFKNCDPKDKKYRKWKVGQPCIARFYLDNVFYRGRITAVNHTTSSCIVHYVDYGNEENCSFSDLRNKIVLYNIPIQAHKCFLSKITPTNDTWNLITLDYIHKSIVDKECLIKVTGAKIGDLFPVSVKIDKININDILVELEMAVYKDGSKPVVARFTSKSKKKCYDDIVLEPNPAEPDYLLEDEYETYIKEKSNNDSFNVKYMEGVDWNKLIDDEESSESRLITFKQNKLDKEFECNFLFINETNVQLSLVQPEETQLLYDELFEKLQQGADDLPTLNGVYLNKACLALFHEDGNWYRASILESSKDDDLAKVYYVDYGNIAVLNLADIKEIREEWTILPPAAVSAQLYGVRGNPDVKANLIEEAYKKTFLQNCSFKAKIINKEASKLYIELRKDDGSLVYENLIQSGILLRNEDNPIA